MVSTQIILLERVDNLGAMGDVVNVKPGYARNYLLPQGKALRATKDNVAYFESQKAELEKKNAESRKAAEKESGKVDGLKIVIIRQASEGGQLYGSVASRDIAEAISEKSGLEIGRSQVNVNQNFKLIGLFPVEVALHPEVKVEVTINIARSEEEAKIQQETGRAMITVENDEVEAEKGQEEANRAAAKKPESAEDDNADEAPAEDAKEEAAA